ncbi:MAG: ABC transporter ATP-binding protein [Gammaproteobacteria bacterium]|nr:ABC transporter ATP-binding protein [Gammaproteobacteria bacterium]
MNPIIAVQHLRKEFPETVAVNDISFSVPPGICFGLLGPNGAGKTTTIEMLEGILKPTSGSILYKGEIAGARFREESGIQFQNTALQDHLTVRDHLNFFHRLYTRTLPLTEIIEDCSLQSLLDRDARKLSGGQRQRLLLAIALINDPDIIFMDEPTTGMDPQARRNFWDLMNRIKIRKKTIILTTHYMEEAFQLCEHIAIMDHGNIIAEGKPNDLLSHHFGDTVIELPKTAFTNNANTVWPFPLLEKGEAVELLVHNVDDAIKTLIQHAVPLNQIMVRPRTLEDLFLQLTGKELRA